MGAGGQDDGDVEHGCDGGVRDDVVPEYGGVVIADLEGRGGINALHGRGSVCAYAVVQAFL